MLPLLPIFASSRITLEVMESVFWLVLILAPITLVLALWRVPKGTRLQSSADDRFIDFLKTIPRNKPMLMLVAITILGGLADGVFSTTMFLYVDVYLQQAENFPIVLLVGQGFMLLALPVCLVLMRRYGKHPTWAGGTALMMLRVPDFIVYRSGRPAVAGPGCGSNGLCGCSSRQRRFGSHAGGCRGLRHLENRAQSRWPVFLFERND